MKKLTLYDLSLANKRVVMRVDFNVPLNKDGTLADASRILQSLPSIQYVLSQNAALILMSHLGRPKGKRDPQYSLKPCADFLRSHLNCPVHFADDCIGSAVEKQANALKPGEVLLLENLRFHEEEEKPDASHSFAQQLAQLGDVYVNDAFGTAHRAHSSTAIIAEFFPDAAAAGFLMEKEVSFLSSMLMHPKHPFFAIIGGAKVSTKIGVLHALLEHVDDIFIGGAMALTFLQAAGYSIGDSMCEPSLSETASEFVSLCEKKAVRLHLPEDFLITQEIKEGSATQTVSIKEGISEGWKGVDIGPKTQQEWGALFKGAATIFWNGPVGIFEIEAFAEGTKTITRQLAESSATTLVGGGDSVAAVNSLKLASSFTHVSTGGGASLEFMQNGHLPGIDALTEQ